MNRISSNHFTLGDMVMPTPRMVALGSIVAIMTGVACLMAISYLPVFAPCRVSYMVRPAQQEILCLSFMALGYVGFALLLCGAISGIVAALLAVKAKWGTNHA